MIIYNLFPKLYDSVTSWAAHLDSIAGMGFDTILVNPVHLAGRSGSLYAVSDYRGYSPEFFPQPGREEADLRGFLGECCGRGLRVFYDLVVHHAAIDSPLTISHPEWFLRDADGALHRPRIWCDGQLITWEDVVKYNMEGGTGRDALCALPPRGLPAPDGTRLQRVSLRCCLPCAGCLLAIPD